MASGKWVPIRISRGTHARLEAARESMRRGADIGLRILEEDDRGKVGFDKIITILLDFRDRHAQRRRAASRRRRDKRRQDQAGLVLAEQISVAEVEGVHASDVEGSDV
jgi:hypothetical protein